MSLNIKITMGYKVIDRMSLNIYKGIPMYPNVSQVIPMYSNLKYITKIKKDQSQ
jgi:hypothetical protein